MKRFYEAEDIRNEARGHWVGILGQLGVATERLTGTHGPCPGCGGRDRFRFDDKDGSGSFLCSQGTGEILSGDGIELYAHAKGIEWKVAVRELGEHLIPDQGRAPLQSTRPKAAPVAPDRQAQKALKFDLVKLQAMYRGDLGTCPEWFQERSPVSPADAPRPEDFLNLTYKPGERVLVFTNFFSQAQYLFEVGRGSFRLAEKPGVKAVPADVLPVDSMEGVWYLNQPVCGKWFPNPRGKADAEGRLPLSRRSQESVTSWRFLVLESDNAPDDLWLNFLAQVPLPIVAVYTSGLRSIHALVRLDGIRSKADFDQVRQAIIPLFSKLGADPGALTAVRLTRLPGSRRHVTRCVSCGISCTSKPKPWKCKKCENWVRPEWGQWNDQKLLYLNPSPDPDGIPIYQTR